MSQLINIEDDTIRRCGIAAVKRIGRLHRDYIDGIVSLKATAPHPGRIPMMPPIQAPAANWSAWLESVRLWVRQTGGDDQEGVIPAAEAVRAEVAAIQGEAARHE